MTDREAPLSEIVESRARAAGIDWPEVCRHASEIVVFGSRAARVHHTASDIDVLVIGDNASRRLIREFPGGRTMSRKRWGLDLVVHGDAVMLEPHWLASELASHISRYGVWLRGAGLWRGDVTVGDEAAGNKQQRLVRRINALTRSWNALSRQFQYRQHVTVRREAQRLMSLRTAVAVAPTAVLDRAWCNLDTRVAVNEFVAATPGIDENARVALMKILRQGGVLPVR
jgi:Nucleotidyltransferase domain